MSITWTSLTQASGIVATVLVVLALAGGQLFSARATGEQPRPAWWLDLHNYLGGLALAVTLLHALAAYRDRLNGIGLLQIFVPMTATGWAWGITWGVLSTYALAAVVFTSWPRRRLSRRGWLAVHLVSMPATFLAAAHAWMVGSQRHGLWFRLGLSWLAGLAVYPAVLRVAAVLAKRRRRQSRIGARAAVGER
jgi:hypothetical protein